MKHISPMWKTVLLTRWSGPSVSNSFLKHRCRLRHRPWRFRRWRRRIFSLGRIEDCILFARRYIRWTVSSCPCWFHSSKRRRQIANRTTVEKFRFELNWRRHSAWSEWIDSVGRVRAWSSSAGSVVVVFEFRGKDRESDWYFRWSTRDLDWDSTKWHRWSTGTICSFSSFRCRCRWIFFDSDVLRWRWSTASTRSNAPLPTGREVRWNVRTRSTFRDAWSSKCIEITFHPDRWNNVVSTCPRRSEWFRWIISRDGCRDNESAFRATRWKSFRRRRYARAPCNEMD